MTKQTHTVITVILYMVFGQVLVLGGMGPLEKPFYFFGAMVLFVAIDILTYYGALKYDRW